MGMTAVIPVRAGSSRIKNKNIKPFAGSSLLELKIRQLQEIEGIDEIVVSSDSREMLEKAEELGVKAKERPYEYCDEKTRSFNDVVQYIAQEQVTTEDMMWVPVVCPLLKKESIQKGLEIFSRIKNGEIQKDSVVSALWLKEYVFDEKGPINFSIENHVPSQKLPKWHTIQNGFFIAPALKMAEWRFVYGPDPYLYEIDKTEAIDIDEEIDFAMAEYYYLQQKKIRETGKE